MGGRVGHWISYTIPLMLPDLISARPSNSRHDLNIEPDSISGIVYQTIRVGRIAATS